MDVRKIQGRLHEAYPYLREKSLHHWKNMQQRLDGDNRDNVERRITELEAQAAKK